MVVHRVNLWFRWEERQGKGDLNWKYQIMHLGGYDNVFLPFRLSILTPGHPLVKSNPSTLWRNVSHVQDTRKLIHNVESRYGAFLRAKIVLSFFFLPLIITCEIIKYLNCLCHYWSTFLLLVSNASLRISGSTNSLVFCLLVLSWG